MKLGTLVLVSSVFSAIALGVSVYSLFRVKPQVVVQQVPMITKVEIVPTDTPVATPSVTLKRFVPKVVEVTPVDAK